MPTCQPPPPLGSRWFWKNLARQAAGQAPLVLGASLGAQRCAPPPQRQRRLSVMPPGRVWRWPVRVHAVLSAQGVRLAGLCCRTPMAAASPPCATPGEKAPPHAAAAAPASRGCCHWLVKPVHAKLSGGPPSAPQPLCIRPSLDPAVLQPPRSPSPLFPSLFPSLAPCLALSRFEMVYSMVEDSLNASSPLRGALFWQAGHRRQPRWCWTAGRGVGPQQHCGGLPQMVLMGSCPFPTSHAPLPAVGQYRWRHQG